MIKLYSLKSYDFSEINIDDIEISLKDYDYILYDPSINLDGSYLQNGDTYIRRKHNAFRYGLKDKNDLVIKNLVVLEDYLTFDLYIYKELIGHYVCDVNVDQLEMIMIIFSIYYLEGKELVI